MTLTDSSAGGDVVVLVNLLKLNAMEWGTKHSLRAAWENSEWNEKVKPGFTVLWILTVLRGRPWLRGLNKPTTPTTPSEGQ